MTLSDTQPHPQETPRGGRPGISLLVNDMNPISWGRGEASPRPSLCAVELLLTTSLSLSSPVVYSFLVFAGGWSRLSWVSSAPPLSDLEPASREPASWRIVVFPCPGRSSTGTPGGEPPLR